MKILFASGCAAVDPCQYIHACGAEISGTLDVLGISTLRTILFETDNTYDIGAAGVNRPRDLHLGRDIIMAGTQILMSAAATSIGLGSSSGYLRVFGDQAGGNAGIGHFLYNDGTNWTHPLAGVYRGLSMTMYMGIGWRFHYGDATTNPTTVTEVARITDAGNLQIVGSQVLTSRRTGWTAATGTATRATFDTTTVTLEQLAQRVKALLDDQITHGLIGT